MEEREKDADEENDRKRGDKRKGKGLSNEEEGEKRKKKKIFFFKQKTAYERSTRDWSSDVCSSDLSKRPPKGLYSARIRSIPDVFRTYS